jgi:hypothetical protein
LPIRERRKTQSHKNIFHPEQYFLTIGTEKSLLGFGKHYSKEYLDETRNHPEQARTTIRLWIESSSGFHIFSTLVSSLKK